MFKHFRTHENLVLILVSVSFHGSTLFLKPNKKIKPILLQSIY